MMTRFLLVIAIALAAVYFLDQYFGWGLMELLYGVL